MRLLPKSIHRCRRYPTKFNSGRDIPPVVIRVEVAEHNIRDTGKINVEHLDISQYGIRMPPSVK